MSKKSPGNLAASVRQKLSNLAKEKGDEFQNLLTRYALERLLYRLCLSQYRDRFILKGAMLFVAWSQEPHRATRDLDLLCHGDNCVTHLEEIFREICVIQAQEDGLTFQSDTVRGVETKEDQEYQGVRITLKGFITGTRTQIPIQVDIGFGDAVSPSPDEIEYPVILSDFTAPVLKAYPRETVVAEKFQAMVHLGMANSRMKDFYDLWYLSTTYKFSGEVLSNSIKATFDRRESKIPKVIPIALTTEFSGDKEKIKQWKAFLKKGKLEDRVEDFGNVIECLERFLMVPASELSQGNSFNQIWDPGGPWREGTAIE